MITASANPVSGCCPEITVILCTRNRSESLGRCLGYYENIQTTMSWELVVVNNGSTDGTKTILEQQVSRGTIPLVVLAEPTIGLSNARNAGIRHARGKLICFSDDDCYPDPGLLDAWQSVFLNPTIGFGGGRIELFDPSDAAVTIKTDVLPCLLAPRSLILPEVFHGSNSHFDISWVGRGFVSEGTTGGGRAR